MRILVLGVSGMFGSAAYRLLSRWPGFEVFGTSRTAGILRFFDQNLANRIVVGIEAEDANRVVDVLRQIRPDAVINAIGIVKQLAVADDPLIAIPINTLLPHRLARLCALSGARLIHISTDCVFSGRTGNYRESDPPDATDLYGVSKRLGEVDYPNAITLRTSIIGPELSGHTGLLEWFLAQRQRVRGYTKAVFSGLTSDELARVIADRVIPKAELHGLYHVSVEPIAKFDLLGLISSEYRHFVEIERDGSVVVDRSLNSGRFRAATGYTPPSWPDLIHNMRALDSRSDRSGG